MTRVEVMGQLRRSPEGRLRGAKVRGLGLRLRLAQIDRRAPSLAFVVRWFLDLAALPKRLAALRGENNRLRRRVDLMQTHLEQSVAALEPAFNRNVESLNQRAGQRALAVVENRVQELIYRKAERSDIDRLRLELKNLDGLARQLSTLQAEEGMRPEAFLSELRRRLDRCDELLLDLDRRVGEGGGAPAGEAAARPAAAAPPLPDSVYVELLDRFRGSTDDIRERSRSYLDRVTATQLGDHPVLDVGCGRGEWLEVLREAGVAAEGVEQNRLLAERCRGNGLEVTTADVFDFLAEQADGRYAAITAFHVAEQLGRSRLVAFFDECRRTLASGGLLILETPNVANVKVGASDFHLDPTHDTPLHPELLRFLFEARGFRDVRLEYLRDEGGHEGLGTDEVARAVGRHLYGPRDFSVVGRKP